MKTISISLIKSDEELKQNRLKGFVKTAFTRSYFASMNKIEDWIKENIQFESWNEQLKFKLIITEILLKSENDYSEGPKSKIDITYDSQNEHYDQIFKQFISFLEIEYKKEFNIKNLDYKKYVDII
jgi:hypothetical protein